MMHKLQTDSNFSKMIKMCNADSSVNVYVNTRLYHMGSQGFNIWI